MSIPRVFHSKTRVHEPWGLRYRASETTDWFPTWREAVDHALVWSRIRHVTVETIKSQPSGFPYEAQQEAS